MSAYLPELISGMLQLFFIIMLMVLSYCICRILQTKTLKFWRRDYISPISIKEGIDNLPAGLLFYYPGGLIKLVNNRMEDICRMMTGEALTDGEKFSALISDDKTFHILPDGTAVSFKKWEMTVEGRKVIELVASDVTKEARLNDELDRKKAEAAGLNKRLRELSDSIKYIAIESEALSAKIKIHDSLGRILLMAKKAITDPGSIDETSLKKEWLSNLRMLEASYSEQEDLDYASGLSDLGIDIVIDGALPSKDSLQNVINTAFMVHVTNVLRHAHGTKAIVTVRKTDDSFYLMTFTNDGKEPGEDACEGGGLGNLRKETERIGGRMETVFAPSFVLKLYLPCEE